MTFSLGQGLFYLPANVRERSAFPFEEPKLMPQSDDFALFCGIHDVQLG
jgi:hypothetical protein